MGCCCSNEAEESVQDGDANERTHLLQDPANHSYHGTNCSNEYGSHYSSSMCQKSDEHSALNKVLQKTANKVIDVGALNCQTLEEHEYAERARAYVQSINKLNIPQSLLKRNRPLLIADVPGIEKILAAPPISQGDMSFMSNATMKVSSALNSIHVVHKEDLVVPFGNT